MVLQKRQQRTFANNSSWHVPQIYGTMSMEYQWNQKKDRISHNFQTISHFNSHIPR
jgi:hypothetical protein